VGTVADLNASSTTITINGDYAITANFVVGYTLTISSKAHGSVSIPGVGTFTYRVGAVVRLLAVADTGYSFEKWEGDKSTIADEHAADTTITMNGNYVINAKFH
jgi:hypothetical protein